MTSRHKIAGFARLTQVAAAALLCLACSGNAQFGGSPRPQLPPNRPAPQSPAPQSAPFPAADPVLGQASHWTAVSNTAASITGDLDTGTGSIRFAGHTFPLVRAHALSPAQLHDAASLLSITPGGTAAAALYRTSIGSDVRLKNRNTLCGHETTTWLVILHSGSDLGLAAFSGTSEPDLSPAVLNDSTALCGTYLYARPTSR